MKTFKKKLTLNKTSVANLNLNEIANIRGGAGIEDSLTDCYFSCTDTPPDTYEVYCMGTFQRTCESYGEPTTCDYSYGGVNTCNGVSNSIDHWTCYACS